MFQAKVVEKIKTHIYVQTQLQTSRKKRSWTP